MRYPAEDVPVTLGSLYSGRAGNAPRLVRAGGLWLLVGEAVQATGITFAASTWYTLGTIPAATAPASETDAPAVSKGTHALVRITSTGTIMFSLAYSGTYTTIGETVMRFAGIAWAT